MSLFKRFADTFAKHDVPIENESSPTKAANIPQLEDSAQLSDVINAVNGIIGALIELGLMEPQV